MNKPSLPSVLVHPTSECFRQISVLTPTHAVARSEQIEARGRRNPEAYAVYVEGFRRPRTKRCDAYRHGAAMKSDHGGNLRALGEASGLPPHPILDFSANINPLGLSPGVAQAIRDAIPSVIHYPDPEAHRLRRALATYHGTDA